MTSPPPSRTNLLSARTEVRMMSRRDLYSWSSDPVAIGAAQERNEVQPARNQGRGRLRRRRGHDHDRLDQAPRIAGQERRAGLRAGVVRRADPAGQAGDRHEGRRMRPTNTPSVPARLPSSASPSTSRESRAAAPVGGPRDLPGRERGETQPSKPRHDETAGRKGPGPPEPGRRRHARTYSRPSSRVEKSQRKKTTLEKFTKERKVKELQSKVERARAEELARQADYGREQTVQEQLKKQIEHCKLLAPTSGRLSLHRGDRGRRGGDPGRACVPGGAGGRTEGGRSEGKSRCLSPRAS